MKEDKVVGRIGTKGRIYTGTEYGKRTRGTEGGDASKREGIGSD